MLFEISRHLVAQSSFDISINRRGKRSQTTNYASKCFPDNFPSFNGGASTRFTVIKRARLVFSELEDRVAARAPLKCRLNFNFGGSPPHGRWISLVVNEVEWRHVARKSSLNHFRNLQPSCTAYRVRTTCGRMLKCIFTTDDVCRGRSYDPPLSFCPSFF